MLQQMHDTNLKLTTVKLPMSLKILVPEVNVNQWKMIEQIFVHDLKLSPTQQRKLSKLIGVE